MIPKPDPDPDPRWPSGQKDGKQPLVLHILRSKIRLYFQIKTLAKETWYYIDQQADPTSKIGHFNKTG